MNSDNELDKLLDDALAEYRAAEPLAGLEDRVLNRVYVESERRRKALWRWSLVSAAAALAIVAWLGISVRARREQAPTAIAQQPPPRSVEPQGPPVQSPAANHAPGPVPAVKLAHATRKDSRAAATLVATQRQPMREQFPSPAPLTSSERVLLALAQTHPAALQELPHNDVNEEIAIVPIEIKPLAETTGSPEGEN
jgi:hypothetical protein